MCAVFGDPHYRSFDGSIYNFQGTCQYTLAQDCVGGNFSIRVRNAARMTNDFAWTKAVSIQFANWKISLQQKLRVKVGGRKVTLPHEQPGAFAVIKGGQSLTLKTTFGIKVIWDGDSYLEISVPPVFKNRMCGLCGNYNGIENDDMVGKDGILYSDSHAFGETWRVGRRLTSCSSHVVPMQSPCVRSRKRQLRAEAECSTFQHQSFRTCRLVVDPEPYLR